MKNIICALLVVALFNGQLFAAGATPVTEGNKEPAPVVKKEEPKPESTSGKTTADKPTPVVEKSKPEPSPTPVASAPVGEPKKLLVQRITGVEVDESVTRTVEETLVLNIGNRVGFSVVTAAEMESAIQFTGQQAEMQCESSTECLVEIQKKLDCDTLIAGKVAKLGDELILSLNTINVNDGSVGLRTTAQAKDIADLKTKLPQALDEILGLAQIKPMFQLKPGETLKLAVMPLAARGVEQATSDALTAILSSELNSIQGVNVIGQDDINAMLAKVQTDAEMQCTDSLECVIEIGASLGLSKLISGAVGKVKDTWVISIQLIDTRRGEVENRVLESFDGEKDELRNAVKLAAYQIAGVDYTAKKGGVELTFNVKEAALQLGAEKGDVKESQYKQTELLPGRYSLRVIADPEDYLPLQTDIYIAPGANNVKNMTVPEQPTPWYKTWWFWTVTGVAIAGAAAATTTVLLLEKKNDGFVDLPLNPEVR
ncbi:MAG TPA: hypothetical protein P5077_07815 [bacterium]|nr:hypothetical protein [bacterium]